MRVATAFVAVTIQFSLAQVPAVGPRRVLNAVTLQPAPSRVTPGGIVLIEGINLGPAEGAKASGMPLPTKLAEPEVEVLINNRAAPLFSVEPNRIVAQVPIETPNGTVQVVVRRGEQRTRPAFISVLPILPAVRTRAGNGFGEAGGTRDGSKIILPVTGMGPTDPTVPSGEVPSGDATPRQPFRVYVGGLLASAEAKLSTERVGEFDLAVDLPEGASAGDAITVIVGNQPPGNRPTFERIRAPEIQYSALPPGAGAAARVLRAPDLRANYVVVHGARGEDGCFPAWLMDLAKRSSVRIAECLIGPNPNIASPITVFPEQNVMVSLVGPPTGDPQSGITDKLALFNPARSAPLIVTTPRAFTNVVPLPDGNLAVAAGGQQIATLNPQTGEVGPPFQGGGGGGVGGGGIPGGGGAGGGLAQLNVDLGDGLNQVLFAVGAGGGMQVAAVGDSATEPKRAKFALVNNQGAAQATADFPEGWQPLLRPAVALPAGPGGQGPGGQLPPGGALPVQRLGVGATATQPNQLFFLARNGDSTGLLAVTLPGLTVQTVAMPEGWQAAACAPNFNFQVFDTTRQLVLFGARSFQAATTSPCNAGGYLLIDPPTRTVRAIPFPKNGSADLRIQPAGVPDMNDYLFVGSAGTNNPRLYDSLFVLDSLSLTPFAMAPEGLRGFTLTGQEYRVDEISSLVGGGVNQAVGDGGLVFFDFESGVTNIFPVPEGFQSIALVSVFATTRKVMALGVKTGGNGTELMLFDLDNQDFTRIPNPDGVAFVGTLPPQQPAGGGGGAPGGGGGAPGGGQAGGQQAVTIFIVPNTKANQVAAMCFNANRQPVGVMAVKIP